MYRRKTEVKGGVRSVGPGGLPVRRQGLRPRLFDAPGLSALRYSSPASPAAEGFAANPEPAASLELEPRNRTPPKAAAEGGNRTRGDAKSPTACGKPPVGDLPAAYAVKSPTDQSASSSSGDFTAHEAVKSPNDPDPPPPGDFTTPMEPRLRDFPLFEPCLTGSRRHTANPEPAASLELEPRNRTPPKAAAEGRRADGIE